MTEFIIVGMGGFIGCCLRFGFVKVFQPLGIQFPIATLVSNVIAGFLVGFVSELCDNSDWYTQRARLFLTTGMMGGLSTFSTFSMETVALFSQKKHILAAGNIMLNLGLSLIGILMGMAAARVVLKARG